MDVVRRNIEFARVRRGISRDELAKTSDIGYKNLANFLSGSHNIIDEKIGRIAIALNVAYDDLFDVGFERKFKAGLAISKTEPAQGGTVKPEPTPAPEPKFEDFVQLLRQMTPAQRDAIIEVMRVMADGNLKKIGVGADR